MINVSGNILSIALDPGEKSVALPNGYSYESLIFTYVNNTSYINAHNISMNIEYHYPVVKSKSPCVISTTPLDTEKPTIIRAAITKFGQIPDTHYFDKAFEPILVTGDDGNEYKVIPSDQFK